MGPFTYPLSSATPNSQLTSSSHSTPRCSAFPTNFQYIFLSLKMKIIAIHIQLCPPCFSSKLLFALPSDPSLKTSLLPGLLCLRPATPPLCSLCIIVLCLCSTSND